MLLCLFDDELDAIMNACRPLAVDQRDAFLQELADALSVCGEIGPGTMHRAIVEAQRRHWDPPDLGHHSGKYR
jgi:hypothetical protein